MSYLTGDRRRFIKDAADVSVDLNSKRKNHEFENF